MRRCLQTFWQQSSKLAIVGEYGSLSYGELARRATDVASALSTLGLREGDRFVGSLPNNSDFVVCYFAALFGGFTIVPISKSLPPEDVSYISQIVVPKARISRLDDLPMGMTPLMPVPATAPDSASVIFFTSGTTSRPKGVCHRLSNLVENARRFNELTCINADVRMMHVMPMGYMAGFLNTILGPLVAGGTVVLAPTFDAATALAFWKPARDHGVNSLWITPTIAAFLTRLNRSVDVRRWTSNNLAHVFVGTASLPQSVAEAFDSTFRVECLESYGMTELMLVSSNSPRYPRKTGSVGRLIDGVKVEARDSNGRTLPCTSEGPLFVQSDFALDGYLDPDSGIADSPLVDDWMETGDIGQIDENGYLRITGRVKDLIIHGGTNVSPKAVEELLASHVDVREAGVVGAPHPFWGEEVVAFVVPVSGVTLDTEALAIWCQSRMVHDATPTRFEVCDGLPRSSMGKIQRRLLRERL